MRKTKKSSLEFKVDMFDSVIPNKYEAAHELMLKLGQELGLTFAKEV